MGRREVRTAVASWARRREGVAAIAFLGAVLCLYLWRLLQGDQPLANPYAPQWQAEVDGRPTKLYPTNYAAMGLPIRAGAAVVDVRYDRSGFWAGAGISAAALLVLALLAAGAGVRSRGAARRDG